MPWSKEYAPGPGCGLVSATDFDQGLADLRRATEPGSAICCTFFKATATNPYPRGIRDAKPLKQF
jgi:hypothetical protein